MNGILYLIPTSIAPTSLDIYFPNFNKEILKTINYFIVENTKTARAFLSQCSIQNIGEKTIYEIDKHEYSNRDIESFIQPIFSGYDIGILSESGCPCIADPGSLFVKYAHEKNIKIKPLVGPSSIILALMASGLNGQNFHFHGYLPIKESERMIKLKQILKNINTTSIFIETPYRNNSLLEFLLSNIPNHIRLSIAINITSDNEVIITKTIKEWKNLNYRIDKVPTIFLLGE